MSEIKQNIVILPEDTNAYLAFRKHREKFLTLLSSGVFDLENGKAVINTHNGQIQTVYIDRMTYKREHGTM